MRAFLITIGGLSHIALARSSCAAVCDALERHPGAHAISVKAVHQQPA